jgi:two-component system sensor histidine kinase CiaH
MDDQLYKKQRIKYFAFTLIAFASIFLVLGIIVFQLLQTSIYQRVDNDLLRLANDQQFIRHQLTDREQINEAQLPQALDNPPPNNFQQQVVLWSKDGAILNEAALGSRVNDFANLRLEKQQLNKITNLKVKDSNERTLQFRSITIAVPTAANNVAQYLQLLINTDPIQGTVERVQQILILCMVIFGLLSIVLCYFLSKWLMQPILQSWKKQQEFVENASHELRTPLTIIQAKLEKLFTRPEKTILEESETIALSLNEVRRLNQLTNDLLLLARSDSQENLLQKEPVLVNQFLQNILAPYEELAAAENKQLIVQLKKDGQLQLDPRYLHQCIVILLDNALKYTQKKDVIQVVSTVTDTNWQFTLSDTGLGIDDAQKEAVFERFYRGEQSRNRKTGGYGIGLSIAKWVVNSHQGTILLSDTQPRGTTVTIKIPLNQKP